MKYPKSIVVKLLISLSLIALVILATQLISEAIFPNAVETVKALLKSGAKTAPLLEQTMLKLKLTQGLQTIGVFLLPAIIMVWILYRRKGVALMFTAKVYWRDFFDTAFLIVFSTTLMVLTAKYSQMLPWPQYLVDSNTESEKISLLYLSGKQYSDLLLNILIICVIPAFCEEFFFRGFLQRVLMKWIRDPHVAIFLAAVIFSAFHFDAVMFFPRFLLGALLGYLFYWTGSLWVPMLGHFINNAQYVASSFILNRMGKLPDTNADTNDVAISNFNVILAVLLMAMLLFTIYARHMSTKELPKVV